MLRRLFVDSTVYTAATALSGLAALVMLPIYTRYLRPEDYGAVDLVTFAYTVVTAVATLEISQGLARHLPEAGIEDERRRFSSTAFWFTAATLLVAIVLVEIAAPALAPLVYSGSGPVELLRLGGATSWLGAMYAVALRQLRWGLRPRAYLAVAVITSLASAGATLALLMYLHLGGAALLWGQAAGSVVGLVLAWYLARGDLSWTYDREALRRMLQFSLPLVVSTLGVLAAGQASRWIVAREGSIEAAGLFGVASRIASMLGLAASGVQLSLGPLIYASYRQASTPANLAASFRIYCGCGLILWAGLVLFSPEILRLLAAPEFRSAADLLGPLGAAVLLSTAVMFAPGLEIRHRTGWVAGVSVFAGALNLVLGFVWVQKHGAIGAAAAMCVSALLQTGLIIFLSQREYPVPHAWGRLLTASAIGIAFTQASRIGTFLSVPLDHWLTRVALLGVLAMMCWTLLVRQQVLRSPGIT